MVKPADVMVATVVLLLLQVPPVVASVSAEVAPTHIVVAPLIGDGAGLMVSVLLTVQPEPSE